MAKMKTALGLGKGLSALIPSQPITPVSVGGPDGLPSDDGTTVGVTALIDITRIRPNPFQPREDFDQQALEDLKKSIKEKGVIQPITVRRAEGGYEIIAGERRVRASLEIGLKKVPGYILDITTDAEMLELALIENVQREHLNPIEIALGYQKLIDECRLTQEEVSLKVGKDRTTVTNFLRLLRLPWEIQQGLRFKKISMGHARSMLALNDEEKQIAVYHRVVTEELSVRRTEELVRKVALGRPVEIELEEKKPVVAQPESPVYAPEHPIPPPFSPAPSDAGATEMHAQEENLQLTSTLQEIESRLRQLLATQVRLRTRDEGSGTIEIKFFTTEELERLLELFAVIERNQYS